MKITQWIYPTVILCIFLLGLSQFALLCYNDAELSNLKSRKKIGIILFIVNLYFTILVFAVLIIYGGSWDKWGTEKGCGQSWLLEWS